MKCIVLDPISVAGVRREVGETVDLTAREYVTLSSLGCVESKQAHDLIAESEARINAEVEKVRNLAQKRAKEEFAKAQAEADALRAEAEAEADVTRDKRFDRPTPESEPAPPPKSAEADSSSASGVTLDLGGDEKPDAKLVELEACEGRDALRDFARKHGLATDVDLRLNEADLRAALENALLAD